MRKKFGKFKTLRLALKSCVYALLLLRRHKFLRKGRNVTRNTQKSASVDEALVARKTKRVKGSENGLKVF